jgi:hypothetical protein
MELTLIHGRLRGTALEQAVDRLLRRGVFDGEHHIPQNLRETAQKTEIVALLN